MDKQINRIVERLGSAGSATSTALASGAPLSMQRSAVRSVIKALRLTAEDDKLWRKLITLAVGAAQATSLPINPPDEAEAVLEAVRDVLNEQYAVLLLLIGYQDPPPPPAHLLVNTARKNVKYPSRRRNVRIWHIAKSRSAIRKFLAELEQHLEDGQAGGSTARVLAKARRVISATLLLAVVTSTEFKAGEEFDFDVVFSIREKAKIEITVPVRWSADEMGSAMAVAVGGVVRHEIRTIGYSADGARLIKVQARSDSVPPRAEGATTTSSTGETFSSPDNVRTDDFVDFISDFESDPEEPDFGGNKPTIAGREKLESHDANVPKRRSQSR